MALRARPGAPEWQNISWAMIPGGSADTRHNDTLLVNHGYEACAVMNRYPGDRHGHDAAWAFYTEQGFNMKDIASFPEYDQEMKSYLELTDAYLCTSDAPVETPPPVKAVEPPPPVKTVEPAPVQAGCTEGATRISQGSGDLATCENGQWHEGPYGYHPGS